MNSGAHSYSKDIYKKFEGRELGLSMQIQGQVTSDNTKYWTSSAIHLSS